MSAHHHVGFAPGEIRTDEPTRSARLKWVIVVDQDLPAGRAANAAALVAAATAGRVSGLTGPDATDAGGAEHPGLPWAGCAVLTATTERLTQIRAAAERGSGVFVADVPVAAQTTRVYDEYLSAVGDTQPEDLTYYAVSLIGPRNRIDNIVHGLRLR